jgi:hypothetical protein
MKLHYFDSLDVQAVPCTMCHFPNLDYIGQSVVESLISHVSNVQDTNSLICK